MVCERSERKKFCTPTFPNVGVQASKCMFWIHWNLLSGCRINKHRRIACGAVACSTPKLLSVGNFGAVGLLGVSKFPAIRLWSQHCVFPTLWYSPNWEFISVLNGVILNVTKFLAVLTGKIIYTLVYEFFDKKSYDIKKLGLKLWVRSDVTTLIVYFMVVVFCVYHHLP